MINKTLRIHIEIINETGQAIGSRVIAEKEIIYPKTAAELGFNQAEQLSILGDIQQSLLDNQADFLNKPHDSCPKCTGLIRKNGNKKSVYHSMYTDHRLKLQKWICTNENCDWQLTQTVKSTVGDKVSPELLKVQAELGAENTYRKSASMLRLMVGAKRKINNPSRIHRTTNAIGKKLEELQEAKEISVGPAKIAKELAIAVDGGHLHDAEHPGHNFEAMAAKVYKLENVVPISKGKNKIKEKHCAGSAKDDDQETMKKKLLDASIQEGLTPSTKVIALADGAKNCWNIIESLLPFCAILFCILDWFHIGKYVKNLQGQLLKSDKHIIESAKTELWFGRIDSALSILKKFQTELLSEEHKGKVGNFLNYIEYNRDHIVNYDERNKAGLIYTSHVAESTVEHYINARFKKKQKMQWNRENAHALLQIRASIIDGSWETIWNKSADKFLKKCA